MKQFRVAEIFGPVIQGEGPSIGKPVHFIRFGGCDDKCRWCDSMHAVDPERVKQLRLMSTSEILDELRALPGNVRDVVLSGGNPLIWSLQELVMELNDLGYWIHVETQGTFAKDWLEWVDELIVSPKPPSAGYSHPPEITSKFMFKVRQYQRTRVGTLNVHLKYVAFDEADLDYILDHSKKMFAEEIFISVGTRSTDSTEDLLERYRTIIALVSERKFECGVRILPQMHVLLHGHKLGV